MSQKKNDEMLWLAQKIVSAYNNVGFVSAVIFGKQGSGKTTYAFKVARDVFWKLNNLSTKDDAWQYVQNSYFFELPDALSKIQDAIDNDYRIPLIIFDDAGIWLSKYVWYEDYMKTFYKIYALIRTRVSAVIFTTPSPEDLAFYLREKGWYQIRVTMVNRKTMTARATLYSKDFGRNSKGEIVTQVKKKALDLFKVQIPDNIYKEYMQRRRETERKLLQELRQILSTLNTNNVVN
ncbi:DnaA-like protein [Sulfolobus spindle-shaped virus 6]|uniref:DnaA-like protein n=1 Tax=Sulfolobus spindle-shaped virus 6 TaxID=693627 RepID=D1GF25_9VIRU|nr:DnaA-like replication initiation protein [Sulfolobus spindle-shaped virus 6]ACZ35727.1 DnaA-like protein [Sulfolobus spindle-shaped virus 6]